MSLRNPDSELDLHSLQVEEALYELERFLNRSIRNGLYIVWIIHGKGKGILRQEVNRHLAGHPLVKAHRLADYYDGGDGVTRVELSDW